MKNDLRLSALLWTAAMVCAQIKCIAGEPAPVRPNILFVLADDLGIECLNCYGGSSYKTPNIDALARSGIQFATCFATPVCSPSRAQLLTGKYNFRTGFIDIAGRSGAVKELDWYRHPTLAMALKDAGYDTAIAGKWHLGWNNFEQKKNDKYDEESNDYVFSPHIQACGFDVQRCFRHAYIYYDKPKPGRYGPDIYQAWVLHYLEQRRANPKPFFLYYPMGLVHAPFMPTPLNPKAGEKDGQENFKFMVEYCDNEVGQLMKKLEELGLRENTLVIFAGDNGLDFRLHAKFNGHVVPGQKGQTGDRGSWVPLLTSMPGRIVPGQVLKELVDFTDFYPTILDFVGVPVPQFDGEHRENTIDGVSFAHLLRGQQGMSREWVFSQIADKWFVRGEKYKLRENGELYDISGSPMREILISQDLETAESQIARKRLSEILAQIKKQ